MSQPNAQFERMLSRVYHEGVDHVDRTGKGRRSIFGFQERFDLSDGTVPVPTSRQAPMKNSVKEMLWFITGSTNAETLRAMGCKFWDEWGVTEHDIEAFINKYLTPQIEADAHPAQMRQKLTESIRNTYLHEIGPMYGAMWRNAPTGLNGQINPFWPEVPLDELPSDKLKTYKAAYEEYVAAGTPNLPTFERFASGNYYQTCDQLNELIRNLKARPHSARHVVSAWIPQYVPFENLDPAENVILGRGSLSVCHAMFQCFVKPAKEGERKKLSLLMYQRSVDTAIGAVSNITQYAVLTHMLAHCLDMDPDEFIYTTGDTHIYLNHLEGVREQLQRPTHPAPKIWINPEKRDLFDLKFEDIEIQGYQHSGKLDYEVAR
jgi:thymidylate synthase